MSEAAPHTKEQRAGALAAALARGVQSGEVNAVDARRVIMHELRRRNTNKADRLAHRSVGAQEVIDKYRKLGRKVPKNDSLDALHADHVYAFDFEALTKLSTTDDWVAELERLERCVCITAAENYRLLSGELKGRRGPQKYPDADIRWVGDQPIF